MDFNILIDNAPTTFEGVGLNTCYRNMVLLSQLMGDAEIESADKMWQAIDLLYADAPSSTEQAARGINWFYSCGKQQKGNKEKTGNAQQAFCFEQDQDLIYSAFLSQYNINLQSIDFLHWWEFMALFRGLDKESEIKQAMYYRTCDTNGMSKDQKKHAKKMKVHCKIVNLNDVGAALSLAERDHAALEKVRKRMEDIKPPVQ